jgi:hypothetical protein
MFKNYKKDWPEITTGKWVSAIFAGAFLFQIIGSSLAQQAPSNPSVATSQPFPVTFLGNINVAPYPLNAVPVTATGSGTTGISTASIPAVAGKTAYLCGFEYDATATAIGVVSVTVTNTISGSLNYFTNVPAQSTSGVGQMPRTFTPCIPATGPNTAISIAGGAPGTGGNALINMNGFYL